MKGWFLEVWFYMLGDFNINIIIDFDFEISGVDLNIVFDLWSKYVNWINSHDMHKFTIALWLEQWVLVNLADHPIYWISRSESDRVSN